MKGGISSHHKMCPASEARLARGQTHELWRKAPLSVARLAPLLYFPTPPSLDPHIRIHSPNMSSSIEKGSSLNSEATDLERSAQPVSSFGGRVHRVAELNKEGNAVQEVRSGM